jgi:hypothetical protein
MHISNLYYVNINDEYIPWYKMPAFNQNTPGSWEWADYVVKDVILQPQPMYNDYPRDLVILKYKE